MTIKELLIKNSCVSVALDYYISSDDSGLRYVIFYDAEGEELDLEEGDVEWMRDYIINAKIECLDMDVCDDGGGAKIAIMFDDGNLTFEGFTYYNHFDSELVGKYERRLDPATLIQITREKNYFSDCEVSYEYCGKKKNLFESIALKEGPNEGLDLDALHDAFSDEYAWVGIYGGHGTIALNLYTGDYAHEVHSHTFCEIITELTTKQIDWFQAYDA